MKMLSFFFQSILLTDDTTPIRFQLMKRRWMRKQIFPEITSTTFVFIHTGSPRICDLDLNDG